MRRWTRPRRRARRRAAGQRRRRESATGDPSGGPSSNDAENASDGAPNVAGADNPASFTWVLSDQSDAAAGLADGRYGAVVTIPKDFSAAATSPADAPSSATTATLQIRTSPRRARWTARSPRSSPRPPPARWDPAHPGLPVQGAGLVRHPDSNSGTRPTVRPSSPTARASSPPAPPVWLTGPASSLTAWASSPTARTSRRGWRPCPAARTASRQGVRKVGGGADSLAGGVRQLSSGASDLASGLDQIAAADSQSADRAAAAVPGAQQFAAGDQQAADGVTGPGGISDAPGASASGRRSCPAGSPTCSTPWTAWPRAARRQRHRLQCADRHHRGAAGRGHLPGQPDGHRGGRPARSRPDAAARSVHAWQPADAAGAGSHPDAAGRRGAGPGRRGAGLRRRAAHARHASAGPRPARIGSPTGPRSPQRARSRSLRGRLGRERCGQARRRGPAVRRGRLAARRRCAAVGRRGAVARRRRVPGRLRCGRRGGRGNNLAHGLDQAVAKIPAYSDSEATSLAQVVADPVEATAAAPACSARARCRSCWRSRCGWAAGDVPRARAAEPRRAGLHPRLRALALDSFGPAAAIGVVQGGRRCTAVVASRWI